MTPPRFFSRCWPRLDKYPVILEIFSSVPADTVTAAILLSVMISPWVVRWRQRIRRVLRLASVLALGFGLGMVWTKYSYANSGTVSTHHRTSCTGGGFCRTTGSAVVSASVVAGSSERSGFGARVQLCATVFSRSTASGSSAVQALGGHAVAGSQRHAGAGSAARHCGQLLSRSGAGQLQNLGGSHTGSARLSAQ